jgi:hypothetical protein
MAPTTRATARAQHTAEHGHTDQEAELLHTAVSDRTGQGTLPSNDTQNERNEQLTERAHSHVSNLLGPELPRTSSAGIGRYTVSSSRILENLNLDSTAPRSFEPLRHTNTVRPTEE